MIVNHLYFSKEGDAVFLSVGSVVSLYIVMTKYK